MECFRTEKSLGYLTEPCTIICTPKLDGKDFVIKVDGTEVKPKDAFLNGDGVFVIWVDATGLSAGEHKVSVTAEGIPDGEASFTVK